MSLTLSSCNVFTKSYDDFEAQTLNSYYQSETISNNRYVLYYYDSTDEKSDEIKEDILSFFKDFEALDFYLVDTSKIETETSTFGGYETEPIVYVISSQKVLEEYSGITEINEFILNYSNIEFDYDLFEAQHLFTYEDVLNIESDLYILYYYLNNCPFCMETKPYFLPWAFTKSVEDIYFMEGSTVPYADQKPTELIVLNSGTPILVLMSNGKFANEFYSGTDDVLGFIDKITDGDIHKALDYGDFTDSHIDYYDTMDITTDLHFEYYYSPTCAHCELIKDQILFFFDNLDEAPFYLINTAEADGTPRVPGFTGTPSLYIIKDKVVVGQFEGSEEIPEFLGKYQQGEIDLDTY